MLRVVETFSGIGAQRQALENIAVNFEISTTIEWEIGAIIAYYLMHHDNPIKLDSQEESKNDLVSKISKFTLSNDGKTAITIKSLKQMPIEKLSILYQALTPEDRVHMTDITSVRGDELPNNTDVLTYSFPCQDLSIGSSFHNGNNNGIKKNGGTRSGLLWEIERILVERYDAGLDLPKFLLMENVMQVFSKTHKDNFNEWLEKLNELGYYNHFSYTDYNKKWILNSSNFGLPQDRKRAFMLSVKVNDDKELEKKICDYLENENNLTRTNIREMGNISDYIYLTEYFDEQIAAHPNYTRSRRKIHGKVKEKSKKYNSKGNPIIVRFDEKENREIFTGSYAKTITTKQDRDPNAGLIETRWGYENNKPYRYLTHRECFGLMGFPNYKFDNLKKAHIRGLSGEKAYKLAGNSICVPILEEIFLAINHINEEILHG